MSPTAPALEDRLARYRPTLDGAIAGRTTLASAGQLLSGDDPVELDWQPVEPGRSSNRSRVLVGASAVVLIGGLAAIVATRDTPGAMTANSAAPVDTDARSEGTAAGVVTDTAPAPTIAGSGLTPACPVGSDTIGVGTLYLGGPASDQNLAAPGFIYSQPSGPTAVDIAMRAVAMPVIGQECSMVAAPTADAGTVTVTVTPPAVPATLRLDVSVSERDGVVGVTGITGSTSFEINRTGDGATLTLLDGVPASATRIQVRFKKGDDVWELTAGTATGVAITLAVPSGETDRFPDQDIDWVLFTAIDAGEHVVDAGGGLV